MSATVANFKWLFNSTVVDWSFAGQNIEKSYSFPIRSAVPLCDGSGVAVVEPYQETGCKNAVIFNGDGQERFRLVLPVPSAQGYWFHQMYYVESELTAIIIQQSVDFAYVVDEETGKFIRYYETR